MSNAVLIGGAAHRDRRADRRLRPADRPTSCRSSWSRRTCTARASTRAASRSPAPTSTCSSAAAGTTPGRRPRRAATTSTSSCCSLCEPGGGTPTVELDGLPPQRRLRADRDVEPHADRQAERRRHSRACEERRQCDERRRRRRRRLRERRLPGGRPRPSCRSSAPTRSTTTSTAPSTTAACRSPARTSCCRSASSGRRTTGRSSRAARSPTARRSRSRRCARPIANELGSARGFRPHQRSRLHDQRLRRRSARPWATASTTRSTGSTSTPRTSGTSTRASARSARRASIPYLPAVGRRHVGLAGLHPARRSSRSTLNPAEGYLTSWNNKQAPRFRANDRELLLRSGLPEPDARLAASKPRSRPATARPRRHGRRDGGRAARSISAARRTCRCSSQVMGPTAPGGSDPRAQDMRDRLAAWAPTRAHRRDFDDSGAVRRSAVAGDHGRVVAAARARDVRRARRATRSTTWASRSTTANRRGPPRLGVPGRLLRPRATRTCAQVLGQPVTGPWSRTYCGGGDLAACRSCLWDALSQAAADLEAEFGSASVADWQRADRRRGRPAHAGRHHDRAGDPLDQPADVPAGGADRQLRPLQVLQRGAAAGA